MEQARDGVVVTLDLVLPHETYNFLKGVALDGLLAAQAGEVTMWPASSRSISEVIVSILNHAVAAEKARRLHPFEQV